MNRDKNRLFTDKTLNSFKSIFEMNEFSEIKDYYFEIFDEIIKKHNQVRNKEDSLIEQELEKNSEARKQRNENIEKTHFYVDGYNILENKIINRNEQTNDFETVARLLHDNILCGIFETILCEFSLCGGIVFTTNVPDNQTFIKEYGVYNWYYALFWRYSQDRIRITLGNYIDHDTANNFRLNFNKIPNKHFFNDLFTEQALQNINMEINLWNIINLIKLCINEGEKQKYNKKVKINYHGEIHELAYDCDYFININNVFNKITHLANSQHLKDLIRKIKEDRNFACHNTFGKKGKWNASLQDLFNVFECFYIFTSIIYYSLHLNVYEVVHITDEYFKLPGKLMKMAKAEVAEIKRKHDEIMNSVTSAERLSELLDEENKK